MRYIHIYLDISATVFLLVLLKGNNVNNGHFSYANDNAK